MRQAPCSAGRSSCRDTENMDRFGDVFDLLRACIGECRGQPCSDVLPHRRRDADPARRCERLHARCDIDGIAKPITALIITSPG
jgi:hypothetical protein